MKKIVFALIVAGVCAQARSTSLATTDGTTYNNITEERVDPDGLYIEYTLPNGGVGMSKVKFSRLSRDEQKQFGFDAGKAKDYEAKVAKANEDFRQECLHAEQAAQTQIVARQTRADQEEKTFNDRLIALAQLKAAEADLARATANANAGGYGWSGGDGFAVQTLRHPVSGTTFAPVVTPIPLPARATVRSTAK